MSFASESKEAICKTAEGTWCCKRSELAALVCFAGGITRSVSYSDIADTQSVIADTLKIRIEHKSVASRIAALLSDVLGISAFGTEVPANRGGCYVITISDKNTLDNLADGLGLVRGENIQLHPNAEVYDFDCCKEAFIRGAFLGGGSIIDPEKNYHMEFVTRTAALADKLAEIMDFYGVRAKTTVRKDSFVVYIKESDAIAELLGVMGAGMAMMELYNIKIEKELRNTVNRQVNCDSANMDKITAAAAVQCGAIRRLIDSGRLDALPDTLREVALLRLDNPDISLKELGEMLNPPIGKSGVNHRLKRILEIAGV